MDVNGSYMKSIKHYYSIFWLCNPVESCTPLVFGHLEYQTYWWTLTSQHFRVYLDTAPSKQVTCTVGFYLLLSEESQRDVEIFSAPKLVRCHLLKEHPG